MPTIKELRVQRGWTQDNLAREAGVATSTISHLENGEPVQRSTLKLVCQALRVRPGEITGATIINRVSKSGKG